MRFLVAATIDLTIQQFLREQIDELVARGHEVHVLTHFGSGAEQLPASALVHEALWSRKLLSAATLRGLRRTRRLVTELEPDCLYVHTSIAAAITRLAVMSPSARRPRVVYMAHGFDGAEAQPPFRRSVSRLTERALARVTDLVIVMNDEDEDWAHRRLPAEVVRVPSVGLDVDHYSIRATPSDVHDVPHPYVLVVAELNGRKRVELVVDAIAHIDQSHHLVVVGDGPRRQHIEQLIAEQHLSNRVHLLGHVDDPRSLIAGATLTLSAARQEGFPRGLLESVALGVPVAALPARGVSDLVRTGVGRLADGFDSRALAEAANSLLLDESALAAARERCESVARQHDVTSIAPMVVDLLERIAARAA